MMRQSSLRIRFQHESAGLTIAIPDRYRLDNKLPVSAHHYPRYLHPAQDDDEHPPHPELFPEASLEELLDPFPMPKRDMSFSVFFEPHFSQATSGFDPKISFSNPAPQAMQ